MSTKVTSNGRVTIPKRVRDYLGLEPRSEVAFRRAADGQMIFDAPHKEPAAEPGID